MNNFTNITNSFSGVTNFKDILAVANTNTGGFAWTGLLIMMQGIILLALLRFGFIAAVLSSAFIALISGMFLVYLELVSWNWLMFFLGQILAVIIYITWNEK